MKFKFLKTQKPAPLLMKGQNDPGKAQSPKHLLHLGLLFQFQHTKHRSQQLNRHYVNKLQCPALPARAGPRN